MGVVILGSLGTTAPLRAGEAEEFLSVAPPGQDGMVSEDEWDTFQASGEIPEHYDDQLPLYEALAFDTNPTESELLTYFKDASISLSADEITRSTSPIPGLTIRRDTYGVPHVRGRTRRATLFGVGYATAQDRLFFLDILRHLGRAKLGTFLPAVSQVQELDENQLEVAPYREEDFTRAIRRVCEGNDRERQLCADVRAYIDGVNAFIEHLPETDGDTPAAYDLLGIPPTRFVMEDAAALGVVATSSGGAFDGGEEVKSGLFLSGLQAVLGETEGRKTWEDFRRPNDPEAPPTIEQSFPYNNPTDLDPSSTALLDPGSLTDAIEPISTSSSSNLTTVSEPSSAEQQFARSIARELSRWKFGETDRSNAVLVGSSHTRSGRPIGVFGPQVGFVIPGIFIEMAVAGPGIRYRGFGITGTNLYAQLGRGDDYAYTGTSSGADMADEWVLKLCEPDGSAPTQDSDHYRYKGTCRAMETFTHQTGGQTYEIHRTRLGFVVSRGTVDGRPVAVAEQRSTYRRPLRSALGFMRLVDPEFMEEGAESFMEAVEHIEIGNNFFYLDRHDIAYKQGCRCPIRDPRAHPDLPTWGTGEWDWTGRFLKHENNPHAINPSGDRLVNWNNIQAPNFRTSDENFNTEGPGDRVELLKKPLQDVLAEKPGGLTRADVLRVTVTEGGTRDLKGQEVYPYLLEILGPTAPGGDAQLQAMRDRLADWVESGAHRRDVDPRDGIYDHGAAVQIADSAFEPLYRATFGDTIVDRLPRAITDGPRRFSNESSSFNDGGYSDLNRAFRQVLGNLVRAPNHRTYCGDGDLATCRQRLWSALDDTADSLTAMYGSSSVADWQYETSRDDIAFQQLELIPLDDLTWINRPVLNMVVEPGGTPVSGTQTSGGDGSCVLQRLPGAVYFLDELRLVRDRFLDGPAGRWLAKRYYTLSR